MGFFSELKSDLSGLKTDLSQAVNTLMPEDENSEAEETKEEVKVEKVDIDSMLNRLDDIKLDEAKEEVEEDTEEATEEEPAVEVTEEPIQEPEVEEVEEPEETEESKEAEEIRELEEKIEEQTKDEIVKDEPMSAIEAISESHIDEYVAQAPVATADNNTYNGGNETMDFEQQTPTDETASITEGMVITGDLQTTGSLDLIGKITGNIKCLGKLNVTGEIAGDSEAAEIYAESARITGEVKSKGSVKVGQSTVIVGNIFGSSAVIAGAVKGDIDVHGPVVLDTTAIVMGNIKSQSVQINNGAVIEGMCSQAYADVNPSEFFETLKNR
ncbi:polymer-forming cytoskeletal protein [Butyrivibrio proteoclasticus]|uniref:polymer-forming cytoskeletal protein n=1 Tax=Butyrivibrio proteoclasticus TaxID=43305 RepID=UPI000478D629|nr:polymer-forming cytoskeletal protein [Butyrivibrio proteoclasticus]